jgi:predicted DNA-binding ribbon-helix-helix protein
VSLEDEFWQAFRRISSEKNMTINELASEIDTSRGHSRGLASAIRVFVLDHYRQQGHAR